MVITANKATNNLGRSCTPPNIGARHAESPATLMRAAMLFQVEGLTHWRIADRSLLRNPAERRGLPGVDHQSSRLTRRCTAGTCQAVENIAHPSRLLRSFHL